MKPQEEVEGYEQEKTEQLRILSLVVPYKEVYLSKPDARVWKSRVRRYDPEDPDSDLEVKTQDKPKNARLEFRKELEAIEKKK